MDDTTIVEFTGRDQLGDPLNDLLKKGAEKLLSAAIEADVNGGAILGHGSVDIVLSRAA